VQLATLIYNDRIVTWKQMKQLDEQLDEKATPRMVTDMAELRIRNLLAFEELTLFNDTGAFRCKHPLVAHKSERAELEDLLKKNPSEFLRKHKNVLDNVRRYESFIKRDDREAKRKTDRNLLRKHKERESIFRTILEKNNDETTNITA